MKQALISGIDVIQVESESFPVHPSLIWVECEDTVTRGYTYENGVFTPPPSPPDPSTDELKRLARRLAEEYMLQSYGDTNPALSSLEILDMLEKHKASGGTKATAVYTWFQNVKNEAITNYLAPNFSQFGDRPYSYLEVMAE